MENKMKSIKAVKETCWNLRVTCKCKKSTTYFVRCKTKKAAILDSQNGGSHAVINGWYIDAKRNEVLCPWCASNLPDH